MTSDTFSSVEPAVLSMDASPCGRTPTICVVDDDPAVAKVTGRLIEAHGFAARLYGSGAELLDQFDEAQVDCVLTDLKMPGMSGIELLSRLRERSPVVSLIVMSGYADVRSAVLAMERGAVTLLEKPFDPAELMSAIDRAVEQTVRRRTSHQEKQRIQSQLATLDEEERQVLQCMLAGLPNKSIASKLTMSPRTVDRRRSSVLRAFEVESVAELASQVAKADAPLM